MADHGNLNEEAADSQLDVVRKLDFSVEEVWRFLLSKQGLSIWLGTWELDKWETGIEFITGTGIRGKIRVFKLYSHIRLSWRREAWKNNTLVHMRSEAMEGETVLSFHQEGFVGPKQKAAMRLYWSDILDEIACCLSAKRNMK